MQDRDGANALDATRRALRGAARRLRAVPLEARAEAIAEAARLLLIETSPLGSELRCALRESTGLSAPVVEHGLRSTLESFELDALLSLHASQRERAQPELAVAVLAGNVFSAAARPLLLPLLCGTALLAKASSADDALPRGLTRALAAADARLAEACAVLSFAHGNSALDAALLRQAEVVSVYGSDETLAAVRAALPSGSRLLAHGHGLGAIFIAAEALGSATAAHALAVSAARDIAAYDQRGCLSPHAVLVQPGGALDGCGFAHVLGAALADLQHELPRGAVPDAATATQLQWRGVAAALGELQQGATWAVSYEGQRPLRPSPGYRNVAVYDCEDLAMLRARLSALGHHLKALGIAGAAAHRSLASLAPYVCEVGAMQTPPLHIHLDRLHPLEGFC
jgi:hypothetical protein